VFGPPALGVAGPAVLPDHVRVPPAHLPRLGFAAFLVLAFLHLTGASAALGARAGTGEDPDTRTALSTSGQFLVGGPRGDSRARPGRNASTNAALVEVGVETLVVSCERVKAALLRELLLPDRWTGRVYVVINPAMTNNQPATIGAQPFVQGWQYRLEVPPQIEGTKLIRGLVHVLLLELANRTAGSRPAELPLWLAEGLALHLARSAETDLVLSEARVAVRGVQLDWQARQGTRRDSLAQARDRLATHAALSFTRLGDSQPGQMSAETWRTFQASAQLFVHHLLLLPGGRAALAEMLFELPHFLNWQTAFLNAFRAQFPRPLDVEKWWSVVLVHFTGLDPTRAWSTPLALEKLDAVLRPPVLVGDSAPELPRRTRLSLQQIIQQWDYLRQRIVLRNAANQLLAIRGRMPLELVRLTDDYRQTLEQYLDRRDKSGLARSLPGLPPLLSDVLVRDTVKKLDELDQRKAATPPSKSSEASSLARPSS
jgi:hypothetical protein